MKVVIFGSRGILDYDLIQQAIDESEVELSEITEIVCGMARGVDSLGEEYAKNHNIRVAYFPPKWNLPDGEYDPKAGYKRNSQMAKYADYGICLWDGKSRGTRHMIRLMIDRCYVKVVQ